MVGNKLVAPNKSAYIWLNHKPEEIMPNQRFTGLLFFAFFVSLLSFTTVSAQMGADQIPASTTTIQQRDTDQQIVSKTGPRYKNRRVTVRQARRKPISRRDYITSVAYKNKRFKRFGKMTETTAPRQRRLMGPAYKNRRFKQRTKRRARFKSRRR